MVIRSTVSTNMSILTVEFIEGVKKKTFDLEISSHSSIDSGGIPQQNIYSLVLDDEFLDFWNYVVTEFGVVVTTQNVIDFKSLVPTQATITQKTRGIDKNTGKESNLPWINKLEVSDGNTTELIEFHPFTCELMSENFHLGDE